MVKRLATILLLLASCAPQPPQQPVPVGNDTFMVPISGGDPRCVEYRMQSNTRAVVQAIFYRRADGTFTMNRAEAC